MNATTVGIINIPTNGRLTRSVPRGALCICDSSSSAASISEKMRRQRFEEQGTFRGQGDAAGAAMKEAHAEAFLHPRHRLADRRRRNAELPPCKRETSGLRRLNEGIQRSQTVHARTSISDN